MVISAGSITLARAAQSPPDAAKHAVELYFKGRILDAIAALEGLAATAAEADRIALIQLLLQICVAAGDDPCLQKHTGELLQILQGPIPADHPARPFSIYAIAAERTLVHDFRFFTTYFTPDFALRFANPYTDIGLYIDFHIVAARLQRLQGQYRQSQASLARALSRVLVLPPDRGWLAARALAAIIELTYADGDLPKAWEWLAVADPFIRSALPPASLERVQYLAVVSDMVATESFGQPAIAATREAIDAAEAIQLDPLEKQDRLSALYAHLAVIQCLTGDPVAARRTLQASPVHPGRDEILRRGHFDRWGEFIYAIAEVFLARILGDVPDKAWLPLLDARQDWAWPGEGTATATAYRKYAIALLIAEADHARAGQLLKEAVAERLGTFSQQLGTGWDAFPLPSDVDRILIGGALPVLAELAPQDPAAADLLLQAVEMVNRGPRTADSDSLAIIGSQPEESGKRLAHSALILGFQQKDWELRRLQQFVARMRQPAPGDQALYPAGHPEIPQQLSEIVHLRQRVDEQLQSKQPFEATRGQLPTVHDLQRALRDDEAYVTQAWSLGRLLRLCVGHGKLAASVVAVDPARLRGDIKLLQAALTATYPPSPELDRQYPAAAARRLHDLLLGGMQACLPAGGHLIVGANADFAGLPFGALLRGDPPRWDGGYDLAAAPWVARDFDLSYVASAKGLLGARQIRHERAPAAAFLGVGDPLLSSIASAGGDAPGLAEQLAALPALPDTRAELLHAATLFPAESSSVLLGSDATEEAFRLQPVSQFDVLELATHGLAPGDLPGLSEAALVLTPTPSGDSLDDGLLTTSEISALDLGATLVILSACNTANANLQVFGHAVQGLTGALALSGVPAIIASLWPVDSETSRRLTEGLLDRSRSRGFPIAHAMAETVRDLIRAARSTPQAHPRFWAPFVMLGDGERRIAGSSSSTGFGPSWLANRRAGVGEILAAATTGRGVVSSEIGPFEGGRSSAIVRGWNLAGESVWTTETRTLGAGLLAASPGLAFAAGYEYRPGGAVAILRAFSGSGVERWTQRFDYGADMTTVSDLLVASDGTLVVAVVPVGLKAGRQAQFAVISVLDPASGSPLRSVRIPYASAGARPGVLLSTVGPELLAVLNGDVVPEPSPRSLDDFALPEICWRGRPTRLVRLSLDNLAQLGSSVLPGLEAHRVRAFGTDVIVAGAIRRSCDHARAAFIGRVAPGNAGLQEIWRSASPFDSWISDLATDGARIFAAGNSAEWLTVTESRRRGDPADLMPPPGRYGDDRQIRRVPFVGELTERGLSEPSSYDSGLSGSISGILSAGAGRLLAYGSVGQSPLIVEYRTGTSPPGPR